MNAKRPNQSVMLKTSVETEAEVIQIMDTLTKHHDILRSVYKDGRLEIHGTEHKSYEVKVYRYNDSSLALAEIEKRCTEQQSSIDLENGPLVKAALHLLPEEKLLFICAHHLVVDGVSWRIIEEDVAAIENAIEEKREIQLPEKTMSFKAWSEALEQYGKSERVNRQREYWDKVLQETKNGMLRGKEANEGIEGYADIEEKLSTKETDILLHRTHEAFNTQINDLLISALGLTVGQMTGQNKLTVYMEGHGREKLPVASDVDRTVGWFTTMYPIVVDCRREVRDIIIAVKETLRRVPEKGLGYGLLYDEIEADVSFNYLGELDAEQNSKRSTYSTGLDVALENGRDGAVCINGFVSKGCLNMVFTYDLSHYSQAFMSEFSKKYMKNLVKIATFCADSKKKEKTLYDYGSKKLTQFSLDALKAKFE